MIGTQTGSLPPHTHSSGRVPPASAGSEQNSFTVRVPATSANLGPGYDCFGLTLARYDEISVTVAGSGLVVDVTGMGRQDVARDESNLVVRALDRLLSEVGVPRPGLILRCRNRIPHGGGQGSSAAAIVGGLVAGRALLPDPDLVSEQRLLELATELEGHPDNVAPALFGGFTLAFTDSAARVRVVRQDVHPDLRAVLFSAAGAASTHTVRSLLPQTVSHSDAAANSAAAALLAHALTVDPGWLFEATADRLHQSYRAPAMPGTAHLVGELRAAGLPAVVSGAGPSVLVLTAEEWNPRDFARPNFTAVPLLVGVGGVQLHAA